MNNVAEGANLDPTEVRKTEFAIVTEVHNQLIKRFGHYNVSNWKPTTDNIRILGDKMFEQEVGKYLAKEIADPEEVRSHVRMMDGYAHFGTKQLYVRASQGIGQANRQILAHEMLHLWFMRSQTDEGNTYSHGVNETLVDTLALEGLGLFEMPKNEREPEIDGAINNSIIIKEVVDKLGEKGWESVFRVCQTGDQTRIAVLMETHFGSRPEGDLSKINDMLPVLFGKSFWGRFKELALMIYYVRQDPLFQARTPAVTSQIDLVTKWAGIRDRFLREMGG